MSFQIIIFTDITAMCYKNKPLGAYHLANYLRSNGYTCLVIDNFSRYLRNFNLLKEILNFAVDEQTKLVGFSSTFFTENLPEDRNWNSWHDYYGWDPVHHWCGYSSDDINYLLDFIKAKAPQTKFCYGGMLATDVDTLLNTGVNLDYIIFGYSESQILMLVDHLVKGYSLQSTKIKNTNIINNDTLAKNYDFQQKGTIIYQDYDCILPNETLSLQTSRGCMYNCSFCSFPLRGRKRDNLSYHLNWQHLTDYFKLNYEKWGITRYQIVDDTFNETTDKLRNFVQAIKESNLPIEWFSFMRVDLIDQEQIDLISDSGCRSIWLGIESLNPQALKGINKQYDVDKALKTIEIIDKIPTISQHASIIFGLNNDSESQIRSWMKTLIDSGLESIGINPLGTHSPTPWPSLINQQPEKFGYTVPNSGNFLNNFPVALSWENSQWNGFEVLDLVQEYQQLLWNSGRNTVSGFELLALPQYGYDIDQLQITAVKDLPYDELWDHHRARFNQYHQTMIKSLISFTMTK